MQRQDHFSSSPVDCSLCKWCLGNQQMKVLQGGMVMQMFHLPAWKSSAAKRERSSVGKSAPLHAAGLSHSAGNFGVYPQN